MPLMRIPSLAIAVSGLVIAIASIAGVLRNMITSAPGVRLVAKVVRVSRSPELTSMSLPNMLSGPIANRSSSGEASSVIPAE